VALITSWACDDMEALGDMHGEFGRRSELILCGEESRVVPSVVAGSMW
jgi:hypothetical protein